MPIWTGSACDVEEAETYSILLAKVCLLEYPSMSVTTTDAYSPGFGAPFARRLWSSSLQCSNTTQSNNFCNHKIYQCIISSLSCDLAAYHLVLHGLVAASHLCMCRYEISSSQTMTVSFISSDPVTAAWGGKEGPHAAILCFIWTLLWGNKRLKCP